MREFESSHSSHAFAFSENFLSLMRKARQMRAFLIASKPEAASRSAVVRYKGLK
jgi:hypothetical protein